MRKERKVRRERESTQGSRRGPLTSADRGIACWGALCRVAWCVERFVLTQMFSPDHSQEGLTEELAKAALKAIVH